MRDRATSAGVFLDFDGSLSAIVERPELSSAATGAKDVLEALVARYRVVAVISGRRFEELAGLIGVSGVSYFGLYGMEAAAPDLAEAVSSAVDRAAALVDGAWVEHKVASVAVHYRQARDAAAARAALLPSLQAVAAEHGMAVLEGKMVLEVIPAGRPGKGGAVERLLGEHALGAALFAGDDTADLDAFRALDAARALGAFTVKVAVRGVGTPEELIEAADVVVDGPDDLVALLRQLG